MNRSALKKYAPQARLDFIDAVTQRARKLGLDPAQPATIEQTGDVLMINGQPFLSAIAKQRSALNQRITQQGFDGVVEALAYTWFNRFVAIRFMELKGYLSHGFRVLSHPEGHAQPEIIEHVAHLDLPGLDKDEVIRLKTAGDQDEALYRLLLLAQCHDLHRNMPFLFEALDDSTELLLPDNLLRTDSVIAHLVSDIDESDWDEVEIIGWLYQFYISDKKDQVIGKVVKSEDIPAATQLFTPNWIVQYLVQNSLGRLWLMANPGSSLKSKMPYYIEPAEQTPEVQAQLDALIKVRTDEDGGTLNPESLTVLDPACGSGHILVEAYNLLRAIYEERGYRLREIPRLILQKNLYGLDIDDRAAQLAGFALMMKAREDDRRLFDDVENPPQLNVLAIQESKDLDDDLIAETILKAAIKIEGGEVLPSGELFGDGQLETQHSSGLTKNEIRELIQIFNYGKTFGSLITVPPAIKSKLPKIVELLESVRAHGDELSRNYASEILERFAYQAGLLALQYDAVVANPPYMGGKGMNAAVKEFAKKNFPDSKSDLFAMFMERGFGWCNPSGFNSMVTMQSWMFLSSYEVMREKLLGEKTLSSMVHMGNGVMGIAFGTAATIFWNKHVNNYEGSFSYCENEDVSEAGVPKEFPVRNDRLKTARPDDFKKIPGSPVAYWLSEKVVNIFEFPKLSDFGDARQGMATADNGVFLRFWAEVDFSKVGINHSSEAAKKSLMKWFPYNKGGNKRRWYGNQEFVVNWAGDGAAIKSFKRAVIRNPEYYFRESISWGLISTGGSSFRYYPVGFIHDVGGMSYFPHNGWRCILAFLNSKIYSYLSKAVNPTVNLQIGDVANLPFSVNEVIKTEMEAIAEKAVEIAKDDWDAYEFSWGFLSNPLVRLRKEEGSTHLSDAFERWVDLCSKKTDQLRSLEVASNRLLIDLHDLKAEFEDSVSLNDVSLFGNPSCRYGGSSQCFDQRFKADLGIELVSYAVGCMMGRYSLDEPGLIYAHAGNVEFEPSRYASFPADADGIIPITDELWFSDDACSRVREFILAVWGNETLVENMEWLADSLNRKAGESAEVTIRRYLSANFFKDHLQTYKKRPIYWLFSSGKQKAFECLVYLHRYNEGTLSRMRMEYVVPLQSRMQARIDKLNDDVASATSSSQQKALQKNIDKLNKQLDELRRFDEKLRTYADKRITLDLDDGVKVNYGKFGDLLAEVKAVTGGGED